MLDHQQFTALGTPVSGVVERLHQTLKTARLPDRLRSSGQALAERLSTPVRLSFMGLPGVGKTTLIQALLGSEIPDLGRTTQDDIPTLSLKYGPIPNARVTFQDGLRDDLAITDLPAAVARGAIYVDIEWPCDRLRGLRVLDLVTDGSVDELSLAARWAAERAEIPIWCSHTFSPEDARIWAQVPDHFKDHAILALTQADRIPPDTMSAWLDRAHLAADAGFSIIAPVAAQHAFDAQRQAHPEAAKITSATGIDALWREIDQRAEQGRQMDIEHAELFLNRFEGIRPRKAAEPIQTQEPGTGNGPQNQAILDGQAYLRQQAAEMLIDLEEFGPFAQNRIVERCLETANHLVELMADDTPVTPPQVLAHKAVSDAADMLLLMTLENTAGAAEDAAHLILQLKREFDLAA